MAIPKNKTRIMITVSNEMASRINAYSEKMGVNRSSMCAQIVGQGIMGFDKAYEMVEKEAQKMIEKK